MSEPDFRKDILDRRAERQHRIAMGVLAVVTIMTAMMFVDFVWRAAQFVVEAAR